MTRAHDEPARRACLLTHRDASVVAGDLLHVLDAADAAGLELVAPGDELEKHPGLLGRVATGDGSWVDIARGCDAVVVLAGDGTLLRVLAALPDGPPVLGVNFGMVGYLSGVASSGVGHAMQVLAAGSFRTVSLPALNAEATGQSITARALNDFVASSGVTGRILELSWRVLSPRPEGVRIDDMGIVPCDGMVLATPVGSTAYNLSNGGPIVAWGVGGWVVSFIAPHTLGARPLVVAPGHLVELEHLGRGAPLQVFADGEQVCELSAGDTLRVGMEATGGAQLVIIDDISFYARYRDSFAAASHDQVRRPRPVPAPPNPQREVDA